MTQGSAYAVAAQKEKPMDSITNDSAEGTSHQLKSKIKEVAGMISDCPNMQAEGTGEKIAGSAQVKIGQFNRFSGK